MNGEDFTDDAEEEDKEEEEERKLIEKNMNPNPRLQRYLVAIEYIGTRFSGAQQQTNCRTVVGVLEVILFLYNATYTTIIYFS